MLKAFYLHLIVSNNYEAIIFHSDDKNVTLNKQKPDHSKP